MVRAAFSVQALGASRLLTFGPFGLWRLLLQLAVPGLPAVGDLRQQGPDSFDVFLCPAVQTGAADRHNFWSRYFFLGDVSAKTLGGQSEFCGSLSSGEHCASV